MRKEQSMWQRREVRTHSLGNEMKSLGCGDWAVWLEVGGNVADTGEGPCRQALWVRPWPFILSRGHGQDHWRFCPEPGNALSSHLVQVHVKNSEPRAPTTWITGKRLRSSSGGLCIIIVDRRRTILISWFPRPQKIRNSTRPLLHIHRTGWLGTNLMVAIPARCMWVKSPCRTLET